MKKHIVLFLLTALFLAACSQKEPAATASERITRVRVIHPRVIRIPVTVTASGMLATRQEMKLSFKTGGIVRSVPVREGQTVAKGETLASLDLSEIQAQASQASVGFEKAQRDLDRAKNLYRDSVVTLETLQNAESAYELAKAQQRIADFNLKHSCIRAPSKGKIQKILVERNEMIAPGYPAILFASTENDWVVRIALTDKDIVKVDVGDSATIRMDAFPGEAFDAVVTETGAIADPVTGTYEVELMTSSVKQAFRTGFISRVTVYPDQWLSGFWLPMEAVVDMNDRTGYVFIADGSTARRVEVVTGGLVGDGVLIHEGLNEEDIVITEGASYLEDGSRIEIITTIN
jgi:RND family efflux transporter MFP subunit